jgi:hypothetical protein
MKQIKKQYPNYYGTLFIYYDKKEKLGVALILAIIFSNTILFFLALSPKIFIAGMQAVTTALNVFILIKFAGTKTREYNRRIVKELYGVEIVEYTKAFQYKLLRVLFIKNLVSRYPKYEDFMADYDEEYHPTKPKVEKKFTTFLLLLCSFVAFLGTFLLGNAPLMTKIKYLVIILVLVLLPILFLYLQFFPIAKEIIETRYKKNTQIMKIIIEVKGTIEKFPRKYVVNNDFKALILNTDLIDESLRPFFKLTHKNKHD